MTPALIARWAAVAAVVAAVLLSGASARVGVKMDGGTLDNTYGDIVVITYDDLQYCGLEGGEFSVPQYNDYIKYLTARNPQTGHFEILNYVSGYVTAEEGDVCFIESVLPEGPFMIEVNCYEPNETGEELEFKGSGLFCEYTFFQQCSENPFQALASIVTATTRLASVAAMPIL